MKCKHQKVAEHKCVECSQPMMIKCTHHYGIDDQGFCKLSSCGQDVRFLTHNTLKRELTFNKQVYEDSGHSA